MIYRYVSAIVVLCLSFGAAPSYAEEIDEETVLATRGIAAVRHGATLKLQLASKRWKSFKDGCVEQPDDEQYCSEYILQAHRREQRIFVIKQIGHLASETETSESYILVDDRNGNVTHLTDGIPRVSPSGYTVLELPSGIETGIETDASMAGILRIWRRRSSGLFVIEQSFNSRLTDVTGYQVRWRKETEARVRVGLESGRRRTTSWEFSLKKVGRTWITSPRMEPYTEE